MQGVSKKHIPAADLRAIALLAAESMRDPARCTLEHLARTRNDHSISVFSDDAVVLGEIGHIYKAGMKHFGFKPSTKITDRDDTHVKTLNAVVRDLDAQIRFISRREVHGETRYTSLVTHWVDDGPETVASLLEKVAARLETGEAMQVSAHHVGVAIDIPVGKREKKVEPAADPDPLVTMRESELELMLENARSFTDDDVGC